MSEERRKLDIMDKPSWKLLQLLAVGGALVYSTYNNARDVPVLKTDVAVLKAQFQQFQDTVMQRLNEIEANTRRR